MIDLPAHIDAYGPSQLAIIRGAPDLLNQALFPFPYIVPPTVSASYQIARSLRFRSAASARLSRTFSGSYTDAKKGAFKVSVKRGKIGAVQEIVLGWDGTAFTYFRVFFDASDKLNWNFGNSSTYDMVTSAVFRDPTAPLDIVVSWDTTQATAANRASIEVNGVVQALSTANYPALNALSLLGSNTVYNRIGCNYDETIEFFDGYLSDIFSIDGTRYTASDFGQIDATTGAWAPKAFAGSYGLKGFHLDFADNSAATAAAIGKDVSGNALNWTPTNISVTNDSLVDTPTNYGTDTGLGGEVRGNFATFSILIQSIGATFSEANLKLSLGNTNNATVGFAMSDGKWFWEVEVISSSNIPLVGITPSNRDFSNSTYAFDTTPSYAYRSDNGNKRINGSDTAYGASYGLAIISVALDLVANTITFYKAGVSQGAISITNREYFPAIYCGGAGASVFVLNTGQRPFSMTAPTGHKALCTQNLPTPAIVKPSNGFVAVTDTGANIAATLAAARAGWTDYIEIFKRRESSEGWRWRSSADTGNYLDSSSTAAKTTFPSLSGSSYVGYAIRCDSGYPARSGTISHTNGVADTITHNLGNARCLIFVKREDSTGSWFVHHPELTAGKLLYLEQNVAETTDASITSIGANSFQIGSGVATGTYRYIVMAETAGFLNLGKHVGNNSADGPFANGGLRPRLLATKRRDGTSTWPAFDAARGPYNINTPILFFHTTGAEDVSFPEIDFTASGYKVRATDANSYLNVSGGNYINIMFAEATSKHARAR